MRKTDFQFSSGLNGLDQLLQGIKSGDNVVLKVGSVADYLPFIEPLFRTA